ncbi:MAG TPA: aminopeptidase [Thermoplasmata archaeon]|nr:aminopeptidase [Thermoplasmata archaeon]
MSEYEALAKNVIKKALHVKPKENVIVETWNHGLPVAAEFVYQLRAAGARPMLLFEDEPTVWRSITTLPKSKLGNVGSHEWKAVDEADAYVFIPGPADISKVREVGSEKWGAFTGYNEDWYKRAEKNRLRGARIALGYATQQRATSYGFDLDAWRGMLLDASSVDPSEILKAGRKVQSALSKKGRLEISAPNGTRFSCDLMGRKAGIEDGIVSEADLDEGENVANIPAGEVYVIPDEKSAEGTIVFDRPIAYLGRWIRGVSLAFDNGKLAKWSATENADMIQRDWDDAKGDPGRERLAYLDIGVNPKGRQGFLQDVIAAGNVYVAVGNNDEVGGKNNSDFFLGASLTGATVTVNDRPVVTDGALAQ